ncbi:hypothetical protein BFJ68_g16952 [Fusarium oxysporum]|uniref:Uncharacterized protein n=1 Tax=Fusarium oxysporum TaxID=5507 RepID=A0A420P6J1_FUSOX|nr:hypothetical protein BFJ68_g16952 [Fusarium oxysporum]
MTSTVIHQLKRILQDTESLEVSLREMHFSQEARTELDTIADKFRALAIMIGKKTQSFKPRQEDISWEKSKSRREKAEKTLTDILTRNKLSDRRVLRKNLITIFCGPDKHMHDSPTITSKKVATGKRCEKLRQLSSDGIIAWAIAYPSASWAGGVMGNDVFDCLLGDIEPNDTLQWPPEVNEMLLELQEKSIQDNEAFNKLVEDLSNPSRYDPRPDDAIALHPIDQPPNQRNRGQVLSRGTGQTPDLDNRNEGHVQRRPICLGRTTLTTAIQRVGQEQRAVEMGEKPRV